MPKVYLNWCGTPIWTNCIDGYKIDNIDSFKYVLEFASTAKYSTTIEHVSLKYVSEFASSTAIDPFSLKYVLEFAIIVKYSTTIGHVSLTFALEFASTVTHSTEIEYVFKTCFGVC